MAESFFATLKTEFYYRRVWPTRARECGHCRGEHRCGDRDDWRSEERPGSVGVPTGDPKSTTDR